MWRVAVGVVGLLVLLYAAVALALFGIPDALKYREERRRRSHER